MTTATRPLSHRLAPPLLAISMLLAAWNWYVQPQRASASTAVLVVLALLMPAALAVRRAQPEVARRRGADSIASGIVFAGLMLASSLGLKLATALGATSGSDLSQRMLMVITSGCSSRPPGTPCPRPSGRSPLTPTGPASKPYSGSPDGRGC